MEICQACGTTIPDGAAFCPNCGNAATATAPQPPVQDAAQGQYEPQQPYYQPPVQDAAPGQYAPQQQPFYQPQYTQQNAVPSGPMPNKTVHTVLLVLGFLCGILWGLLALGPYKKMSAAIDANNSIEANNQAKKVRIFAIIGIVLNVLL